MSVDDGILEHMFESDFASADDKTVVAAIEECARAEAMLAARRLAATAELTARYTEPDEDRDHLAVDGWRMASAEISAAMRVGDRAASSQMCIAMALRERLPKVAALFAQGRLSAALVSTITWRTQLIVDSQIAQRIDTAIAQRAGEWGGLSVARLESAIDSLVDQHDPDARRRMREAAQNRDVRLGKRDDVTGTMSLWGRLSIADGELLKRRLAQLSSQVCKDDPRTAGQRRSEALGAIAANAEGLSCRCGSPDCPSAGQDDPRAAHFVINVITEANAPNTEPVPATPAESATAERAAGPVEPATEPQAAEPATERSKPRSAAALIIGGGLIPTPLLAELIKNGAKVQWVHKPPAAPETGYRPSGKTARFVRMRDMTCRFPGCTRPAEFCDLDHTTPSPAGATHPSNLKCLCRIHHLLKTFGGWGDQQHPDGTVLWTAPSGRTYFTHPGSRLFYPGWDTTTATLLVPTGPARHGDKGAMMPRRRRTRAQDRLRRIERERALNAIDRKRWAAPATTQPSRPPPQNDDPWKITTDANIDTTDTDPAPF
ncbi:DUF222 domain-containing protein [Mycobacterium neumannii]|uniref:HNH endonuclease signature motif containing protein n=1 Tax=Mycobacterium neumannii TaxID=2048551 RepID=UPI003AB2B027